jgi:hypothetical protein
MADKTVKINGNQYALESLSPKARTLMRNIEIADEKIRDLQQQAAMIKVARESFGKALIENLPKDPKTLS